MGIPIKIQRLTKTARIPIYSSDLAACTDLYADIGEDEIVEIAPHSTIKIGTGIAVQPVFDGYCFLIYARSGLATKQGLRPANCVGVIDGDYTGEVIVALHNDTDEIQSIKHGDRIGQMMLVPYFTMDFREVDKLTDTERGSGGFGSTGV